ncbi:MAG: N-formylglutamate amidohydrolase [Pseudomonadota bacterium]
MREALPFRIQEPQTLAGGTVFSSPHSGRVYPPEMLERSHLDLKALRASEDAYVEQLFSAAPEAGAPILHALAPRAWLDLNRAVTDLDPELIEGVQAAGPNQRVAAGLGVVPRVVSEGQEIYRGKIARGEAEARIKAIHEPYHAKLSHLLEQAHGAFGLAVLFDCHSMPSEALRAAPRVRGRAPDIVLGDRFGASAGRGIVARTQEAFERVGFRVARNAPFAGGYITQRYGQPARGIHAVQIEIDRGLYLDQRRVEPGPRFAEIAGLIAAVIPDLVQIGFRLDSVAAE